MARESGQVDFAAGALNVEELLRMLEDAVEKEFAGMKKTCEGLGANNSERIPRLKKGETTSSSSAGTPNSTYSTCSASGSIFSRCSYGKEKSLPCVEATQDEEVPVPPCTSASPREAGWNERHEAVLFRIRTKLEAAAWAERVEVTPKSAQNSQLHSDGVAAASGSRILRPEECDDVDMNVSTLEETLGNFQTIIQGTVTSDADHLLNQRRAESCSSERQGELRDDNCTDGSSINSNAAMENREAFACSPCDAPLASSSRMELNINTTPSVKKMEASVQCDDWYKTSCASQKIVGGFSSFGSSDHGSTAMPLDAVEKKMEGLVCGTNGVSSNLVPRNAPEIALSSTQMLDCETLKTSAVTGEKVIGEFTEANIDDCELDDKLRVNKTISHSTIQEREETVTPRDSYIEPQGYESDPGGQELSTLETTGDRSPKPCAHGRKDTGVLEIEGRVEIQEQTRNLVGVHATLQKFTTSEKYTAVLVEPEDASGQLETSYHEIARSQEYMSTPEIPARSVEETAGEATNGTAERPVTAYEYFHKYGWDEAKLMRVSDVAHIAEESQCHLRPKSEEGSKKNKSVGASEQMQITHQATEASNCPSEYFAHSLNNLEISLAKAQSVPLDYRVASTEECRQVHHGDPRAGHAHKEEQQLVNEDEVVEHAVGFGSDCCTPSRRGRGLGVPSKPCCKEGMLVGDCSQVLHGINQNDSIFSSSTFVEMEKAASSCILGINSNQLADWEKVEPRRSRNSCNESTRSAPSETFFDRLLQYGRSVNRRNQRSTPVSRAFSGSSVLSKLAGEVMERSNSQSPAQLGGCNRREKVKVLVRMRPFAEHEKLCPVKQILCLPEDKVMVKVNNPEFLKQSCIRSKDLRDAESLEYKVDSVVDDSYLQKHRWDKKAESQKRMYELIGLPCLEYALDGYNTTIMAYGQVGSGKTFTMMGDDTEAGRGIVPRLAEELMNQINTKFRNKFIVQVSYLEIYKERIRDLLVPSKVDPQTGRADWQGFADSGASRCGSVTSERRWSDSMNGNAYEESTDCDTASYFSFAAGNSKSWRRAPSICFDCPPIKEESLRVREHPVLRTYVEGLLWKDVYTWDDMEKNILEGAARRTLGPTPSNKFSNRGHTVFTIRLVKDQGGRSPNLRLINLVDLAGTEKPNLAKRVSLERLDESRYINRSIAHLNDVILNLSKSSKFVSYRNSSLTKLLRDSLEGNYKTFLIAHLSPAEQDFQESVNTLRYAAKASHIQSSIYVNPEKKNRFMVNMTKDAKVLHDFVHNLTRKEPDGGTGKQELLNPGSCFPVSSSFEFNRVGTPTSMEQYFNSSFTAGRNYTHPNNPSIRTESPCLDRPTDSISRYSSGHGAESMFGGLQRAFLSEYIYLSLFRSARPRTGKTVR